MHVTFNGENPLRTKRVGDWTYDEADRVRELTGLLPGDVFAVRVAGDPRADLAFGIVAYVIAGRDPAPLKQLSIETIVVHFDEEDEASPPASGAAATSGGAS